MSDGKIRSLDPPWIHCDDDDNEDEYDDDLLETLIDDAGGENPSPILLSSEILSKTCTL